MLLQTLLLYLLSVLVRSSPFEAAAAASTCIHHGNVYHQLASCSTGTQFCESYLSKAVKPTSTVTTTTVVTADVSRTVRVHRTHTIISTQFTSTTTVTAPPSSTTTVVRCDPANVSDGQVLEYPAYSSGFYDYVSYSSLPTYMRRDMVTAEAPAMRGEPAKPSCGISSSFSASGISSDCSCLLTGPSTSTKTITKSTIVTTVTSTLHKIVETTITTTVSADQTTTTTPVATKTVGCMSPDTTCDNQGLAWAYYRVPHDKFFTPFDPQTFTPTTIGDQGAFNPVLYKTLSPQYSNITQEIGGWFSNFYQNGEENQAWNIYGHLLGEQHSIIDHVTYFYPPKTGKYAINFISGDNVVLMWIGEKAYSGWTVENADFALNEQILPMTAHVRFEAGHYYPIRIYFGTGFSPDNFAITITAPGGSEVLGSNQKATSYFVTHACNRRLAPPFPPFGHET